MLNAARALVAGRVFVMARGLVTLALACLTAAAHASCGAAGGDDAAGLTVAAASNLTEAFEELGRRFTERTGTRVTFSFGATGDLARQIENGAPFDLFAAADTRHAEGLESKGLLAPGTRRVYALGRLVLWVPPGARAVVERMEDVAGAGVSRVALAKPDVAPYGRAAVEALGALGLWERVEPKVVYGQSVSQVRQFAASGNADAAFLPRALVREGEGRSIEVDERLHAPIEQALGVVAASKRRDAARAFAEFVMSAEGQALLERYGYRRP